MKQYTAECPRGHQLRPGRILNGWSPCVCPPAWDEEHGGYGGHRTTQCETCRKEGYTVVRYDPPHIPADGTRGHPNRGQPGGSSWPSPTP